MCSQMLEVLPTMINVPNDIHLPASGGSPSPVLYAVAASIGNLAASVTMARTGFSPFGKLLLQEL